MSSKFKTWLHHSRGEEGQAMVMAAFAMVVILGFGAFAVDIGHIAVQKSDLQNAADATALASVVDRPSSPDATALKYAQDNGMSVTALNVEQNGELVKITPIGTNQLRVECSRKVDYYFAGVLGFESKTVTAVAVAEKNSSVWSGEALPFVNTNIPFAVNKQFDVRDKGGMGSFDSIEKTDRGDKLGAGAWAFHITWVDGLLAKKGIDNSVASEIDKIYLELIKAGGSRTVYLFSLSNSVIDSKYVNIVTKDKNGNEKIERIKIDKLGTKDNIHVSQLVLLECTFDLCTDNSKTMKLTTKAVFDLGNNILDGNGDNYADIPTNFEAESGTSVGAKLIL